MMKKLLLVLLVCLGLIACGEDVEPLKALQKGAPIFYRGIQVGEVTGHKFAENDQIEIDIFIRAPHDKRVRGSSRFWKASGIDVTVDASGINLQVESLAKLIAGGIEFDTPLLSGQRDQPVQCAAVQQVPAQLLGKRPTDRSFARPTRPVDGDDRHLKCGAVHDASPRSSRSKPTPVAVSTKPGKDVATLAVSSIRIGCDARRPATAIAIATR